jgi:putative membrane protein insertion efficiency factor
MLKKVLIKLIKFYQATHFMRTPTCRFHPTCSNYALQALEKYGAFKGSFLALKRILKCHPFGESGYDPVK